MRKGIKKLVSGILSGLLLLTLLQTGVTVQAETGDTGVQPNSTPVPYTENTGDFTVTGGTYGTDYEYDENNDVLIIRTSTELTITTNGKPTSGMIWGQSSDKFNIVLQDVYLTGTKNDTHINFFGNLNLTISGTNKIDVTGYGLECVNLTITSVSTGSLVLAGTVMDLRLGGDYATGNLTVNGGTLAYNKAEISGTTTVNAPGTIKQIAPAPALSSDNVARTKNSLTVNGTFDTAAYGNVEYQWDGGTWGASASLSGLTAGSGHSVAVRYKGNDQYWQSDASTTVSVSTLKDGSTLIAEPSELKGTYGQLLSDVSLPEGWSWENSSTTLTVGASSYPAVFDTVKHEADDYDFTGITGYDSVKKEVKRNLTIAVEKADSMVTITTEKMDKKYDKEAVSDPEVKKTGSTKDVTFTWYQKTQDGTWKKLSSAPANAGSYKVEASVEADTNYKEASAKKEFVISKAENKWTKELSMEGWTYGEKAKEPTAEAKFGDVTFSYSKDKDGTYSQNVPTEAGIWYVKASVAGNDNYTGLEAIASFKIAKADSEVTITTEKMDKKYDKETVFDPEVKKTGSTKAVTFTWYQKTQDGTWKKLSSAPANAGSYKVEASVEADTNYKEASAKKEFVISKAENKWTKELSMEGWTYGEKAKEPTAEAKFGNVTFSYSKAKDGTYSKDVPTEAGTWYAKASVAGNDNYTGLEAIASFKIAKADSEVTITTEKMDKKYDKEAVSDPEVKKTGSTKDVTFTWYQKTQDGTWKKLSSAPVNVGSYKVEASVEADTNYKEASAKKEFVISKAENKWTKELSMEGWTYDEQAGKPSAAAKYGTVVYTYSDRADGTFTDTVPTNAGTWYVKASVAGNDNYTGLEAITSFRIAQADSKVTITTEKMDKKYDKEAVSDPEVKKTGSTKDVTFTWYQKTQDGTWKKLSSAPVNVGSYKVEASVEADTNYKEASAEKEFVISKAENEWTTKLSIEGWTYGETAKKPTAEAKFGDVVFSYSNEKNGTYRTEIPTEAGTWYVKAVVEETDNYTGLETVREFTILEAETLQDTGSSTDTDNVNSSTGTDQSGTDEEKKDSNTENDMKTGETADVFMWGTISVLSALGIWTASVRRKRRK